MKIREEKHIVHPDGENAHFSVAEQKLICPGSIFCCNRKSRIYLSQIGNLSKTDKYLSGMGFHTNTLIYFQHFT